MKMKIDSYMYQQIDATIMLVCERIHPLNAGETRLFKKFLRMLVADCLRHQLEMVVDTITEEKGEEPSPFDTWEANSSSRPF